MADDPNRKGSKTMPAMAKGIVMASRVGLLFSSEIIGSFALGYLLDRWLGTRVLMMIIFTLLGVVGAFLQLNKILDQYK